MGDLQCSSQIGNVTKFNDFFLIVPTEREARIALSNQDDSILEPYLIGNEPFNKNDLNIFSELQMWNDEATNTNYASIFNDKIGSKFHLGGGLIRFGNLNATSMCIR